MHTLPVDEVNGVGFQLVGTVQISQDQDFADIVYGQVGTQGLLTHYLQPFQGILQPQVRKVN